MANANRDAGHTFEREVVRRMKLVGFKDACTSRAESKRTDDAGIDLCFTQPLAIQVKRLAVQPNFRALLSKIAETAKGLVNWRGSYVVIYHKRKGERPTVTMDAADFEEIVGTLIREGIWKV